MTSHAFESIHPTLSAGAWIAPNAYVMGRVSLGADSNIWYGSVLRGDVHDIQVGERTNIQDLSVIHVTSGQFGTYIGDDVTVGHRVILHGCTIGRGCLIGMGSTVLDGVEIGEYSLVGAGSLVTPGKKFPPRSVIMGSPARVVREVTDAEVESFMESAKHYVALSKRHESSLAVE